MIKSIKLLDRAIHLFCVWALVIALILMISLTILNILLRWADTTILWIEPMVRQLVFTCAFLGGAVATGARNHIAIDLTGRIMETFGYKKLKLWVDRLIFVFCVVTTVWLAYAGYLLVLVEQQFGHEKFLGIHSSVLAGIIPVGLILIGFRFLVQLIITFTREEQAA